MTVQELQTKLDAANEKVAKRLTTIEKLCKKLGVNYTDLINEYRKDTASTKEFLRQKEAEQIVSKFVTEKEERNADGTFNDDNYEFNFKIYNLAENLSKLFEVERVANGWQVKLDIQRNKEQAPKIKPLWDFLTNWENDCREWYQENAKYLVSQMNEFHEIAYKFLTEHNLFNISYNDRKALKEEFNKYFEEQYGVVSHYRYSAVSVDDWTSSINRLTKELTTVRFKYITHTYDNMFGYESCEGEYYVEKFNLEKLNKVLQQEKQLKYEDLCNRISAVVGEITDVSDLRIGRQQGELNGIVTGTKGKARVETIGAGGWNIQCFHYRVLVHKM